MPLAQSKRHLNHAETTLYNSNPQLGKKSLCMALKAIFEEEIRYTDAGDDSNNSNAFLHTYWIALLAKNTSTNWGLAHESDDYKKLASKIDTLNNQLGIKIGTASSQLSDEELAIVIEEKIDQGEGHRLVNGKIVQTSNTNKIEKNIFTAIYKGALSIVLELVQLGYCNQKNEDAMTPLMLAALNNSNEMIKAIAPHCDINAKDNAGEDALMHALKSDLTIVDFLIKSGINLNHSCHNGETALMKACAFAPLSTIKLLVSHGASITTTNKNKTSALDIARCEERSDVIEYLQQISPSN